MILITPLFLNPLLPTVTNQTTSSTQHQTIFRGRSAQPTTDFYCHHDKKQKHYQTRDRDITWQDWYFMRTRIDMSCLLLHYHGSSPRLDRGPPKKTCASSIFISTFPSISSFPIPTSPFSISALSLPTSPPTPPLSPTPATPPFPTPSPPLHLHLHLQLQIETFLKNIQRWWHLPSTHRQPLLSDPIKKSYST